MKYDPATRPVTFNARVDVPCASVRLAAIGEAPPVASVTEELSVSVIGGVCGLPGLNVIAWPVVSITVHCVADGQAKSPNRETEPSETGEVRFGACGLYVNRRLLLSSARHSVVVGHFTDPEGHLMGLAGPA